MLDHPYVREDIAPTCTEYGCVRYTCSICGDFYEEDIVDALGHTGGEWVVSAEPSFEADGCLQQICTVCGGVADEKSILMLIRGDANRDGLVNAEDLTLIRKMLIGIITPEGYQNDVIDVNGDGAFDIRDLIRLKKNIAS